MSAVCIIGPVVIAAWPAFGAAVAAAGASLGYQLVQEARAFVAEPTVSRDARVELEIPHSEIVTSTLGRDQRIRLVRDGVTVTFSRDVRGRASVCVAGKDLTESEMRALGEELSQRVVQHYVYQRLTEEMRSRGYHLVSEEVDERSAIRLRVRHWDN